MIVPLEMTMVSNTIPNAFRAVLALYRKISEKWFFLSVSEFQIWLPLVLFDGLKLAHTQKAIQHAATMLIYTVLNVLDK